MVGRAPSWTDTVTACVDHYLRVTNPHFSQDSFQKIRHLHSVWSVAASPTSDNVATGCEDGYLRIVHPLTANVLKALKHPDAVRLVTWSPSGRQLATACADNNLRILDGSEPDLLKSVSVAHHCEILCVAWRPHGHVPMARQVVTTCTDRKLRVIDTDSGEILQVVPCETRVRASSWSPCGLQLIAGCDDGSLRQVKLDSGMLGSDLLLHSTLLSDERSRINAISWNQCGRYLAVGCSNGWVYLVDLMTKSVPSASLRLDDTVFDVAWNSSGDCLAVAVQSGRGLCIVDVNSWTTSIRFPSNGVVNAVAWLTISTGCTSLAR